VLAARPDVDPLTLAHHAREAGDAALAASALVTAASLAAARFDLDEARRLVDESIALVDTAAARLLRGRIRIALGDVEGADADSIAAVDLGGAAPALLLRAWVARVDHRMEDAIVFGEKALALDPDERTRADCHVVVGWARRSIGHLPEAEVDLEQAVQLDDDPARRAWLGLLRVNQGRPVEALDLIRPALEKGIGVTYGFQAEQSLQSTTHALAMAGRPAEALATARRLGDEIERRGSTWRYGGLAENYQAWILRNLHLPGADDLNQVAAVQELQTEVRVQGTLDLAAGRIDAVDLDSAQSMLDRADEWARTERLNNRWRCEQRSAFQRSRLLLAAREAVSAHEVAAGLAESAGDRGDDRYATFGRIQVARALAQQGKPVDLDRVEADLERLVEVAGLEAWWLTADVARDLEQPRIADLAARRAQELAAACGEMRTDFEAAASRYLSS
jgi:tetratricopeptide (TPR) repeat protein